MNLLELPALEFCPCDLLMATISLLGRLKHNLYVLLEELFYCDIVAFIQRCVCVTHYLCILDEYHSPEPLRVGKQWRSVMVGLDWFVVTQQGPAETFLFESECM